MKRGRGRVNDRVVHVQKAGAFVLTNKRMAFMMGPTVDQSELAIVRLGGHKEGAETAWECSETLTLDEFKKMGGKVIVGQHINGNLPFKPFGHLRMLSFILEHYPNVISTSIFC